MSEGPETSPEEQRAQRLEAALAAVTARVYHLEQEVAALRGQSEVAVSAPVASPPSAIRSEGVTQQATPITATPGTPAAESFAPVPGSAAAPIPAAPPKAGRTREDRSVESRLGSQWFNRIGIIAVLIGVALFLKFAFDNHWVGAAGRVLIGLVCGAALIAWSERFRSRGYTAFSFSLKAVGSGVLYLSLWAAFSVYHLIPPGVAFAGMVMVTMFNAFIAWLQSAELLAVYAIVGAFLTPLLLSTGRNEEVFLFSYLLVMNAATMALLVLKGWNRLLPLSFLGTVAFYWGWYWQFYTPAAFVTTTVFLSFFILLFAAGTVLARRGRAHPEHGDAARALVSMANAAFGFLGFHAMLSHGSGQNTALAWCSVGFGAFYLGVRKWMERTPIAGSRLASLSDVQLSIAIVFLTLAVPLAVHGYWVTVGWMAEGAVLVWVATRVRTRLMQFLAVAALALGLISLAMDATIVQTRVFWNTRLLSFAVSAAAMAVATLLARDEANRERATMPSASWELLAQTSAVIGHVLLIIAVLFEIHTWWWSSPAPAPGMADLRTPGSLLSSAIWLMAASGAMIWAAIRGKPGLRKFMVQHATAQLAEAVCWALAGLILLCIGMIYPQQQVIWNLRFVTFLIAIVAMTWVARHSQEGGPRRASQFHIGASVLATVLALTAICFEISTFWSTRPLLAAPGSVMYASQLADRHMAERFSYSAWFLLAGAVLLVSGFRRGSALLRWQALVLLAVTICKVFVLDTSTLSQGYRIVSFLALGALLLAVSFAYQRDWLQLRAGSTNGGETK